MHVTRSLRMRRLVVATARTAGCGFIYRALAEVDYLVESDLTPRAVASQPAMKERPRPALRCAGDTMAALPLADSSYPILIPPTAFTRFRRRLPYYRC